MADLTRPMVRPLTRPMQRDSFGQPIYPTLWYAADKAVDLGTMARVGPTPDFTRASGATQFNASSDLVWAPENLVTYSENFDPATSDWAAPEPETTVNTDQATAPDGSSTADELVDDGSGGVGNVRLRYPYTAQIGLTYKCAVSIKANGSDWIALRDDNGFTYFDVQNGVIGTTNSSHTASIEAQNNGFYLCTIESSAPDTVGRFTIYIANGDDDLGLTLDGTNSVYIWGAHLYRTPNASTAYVKTTGSAYYGARFTYDPATGDALGLLREPQRTNKCANFNASPTDLTEVTLVDSEGNATLTVVDDSTELTAAGINIGNGNVYKLDATGNSTTNPSIRFSGSTGNTNSHTVSVYRRGSGGQGRPVISGGAGSFSALPSDYERDDATLTPSGTGALSSYQIDAGAVAYITLNQLEEGAFATSPIIVAGSAVTRNEDVVEPVSLTSLGYSGGPCTVVVRHRMTEANTPLSYVLALSDETIANDGEEIQFRANRRLVIYEAGSVITNNVIFTVDGNEHTVALSISAAGVTVYEDGVEVYSDTTDYSTVLANVTDLRIGYNADGTYPEVTFYPSALPASELARETG